MLQIEITIDKIKNIYLLISTLRQQSGRAKRHMHSMHISFASAPAKGPKTGADVNFLQGSYPAKFIHISQKYFCISAY